MKVVITKVDEPPILQAPMAPAFASSEVVSADVILEQTVTLPKWDGYENATEADKAAWDAVVAQIREHEEKHVQYNREAAQELDKALPGTRGVASGKNSTAALQAARQKRNQAVNAKIQKVKKNKNQKDDKLDGEAGASR